VLLPGLPSVCRKWYWRRQLWTPWHVPPRLPTVYFFRSLQSRAAASTRV